MTLSPSILATQPTQTPYTLATGFADLRIGQLLQKRAAISPQWPCWRTTTNSYTYEQLYQLARQVAAALLASNLAPQAIVGVVAKAGFERWAFQNGIAIAGMVAAHGASTLTQVEMTRFCQHSTAQLLLIDTLQLPVVEACLPALSHLTKVVMLPADQEQAGEHPSEASASILPAPCVRWQPWLALGNPPKAQRRIPNPQNLDPSGPFQMLYTSGVTGAPKGVCISHRAKIAQGLVHSLNLGLQPQDLVLSALPAHHQFAQWLLGVSVPLVGACVYAMARFSAHQFWQVLTSQPITCLPAVPTMLYRLLNAKPADQPPTQLRSIVYGAAPIQSQRIPQLRRCFPDARLFQGFGQTEAGYCLGLHDAEHDAHPQSIGRPDLFSETKLINPQGQQVALGEVGELVVRTPYMMNGYHGDAAASAAYFSYGQGWGRTGDLARCDALGFYTLAGRAVECINSGGVSVYPLEIERVLAAMQGVGEVSVLGLPHADWGEEVVCVWEAATAEPHPTDEALHQHCQRVLAPEKRPKRFVRMQSLVRTASGKIDKARLKQQLARLRP